MKIASVQLGIRDDESKAERTERALALVEGCAGADLILLPEIWNTGYFGFDRYH
jgi:predicted amidohydrolase